MKTTDIEKRSIQNSIRSISDSEGIVDAYLTAWDTIDSYKTSFQRGCFKKTFENRANKIKVLWNHGVLAGKCLEAREDEYGAFVRVQLNLATETGRTAFEHIKAGDVDSFSFGFNVIQDKWVDGIRTFTEVKVLECSPVLFPANDAAIIVDVRQDEQTQDIDIEPVPVSYCNDLQKAVRETITADIVKDTTLTISEFQRLDSGQLLTIESRNKLAELPEIVQAAHKNHRRKAVETLCNELREAGFTPAEKTRFVSLLAIEEEEQPEGLERTINYIKNFRNSLNERL